MKKFSSIKKVSSHRSFSTKPSYRLLIAVLGVFVLAALILPSLFSFLGSVVLAPVRGVATWLRESPSVLPAYLRDRSELIQKQNELQAAIDQMAGTELTLDRLVEENIALRSYHGEGKPVRLLTRVVARPPFLPYDLIQLDKGAADGVEVGAPVFAGKDIVIGTIVEVGSTYAFAELVTSPNFAATVYVPGALSFVAMEGVGGGIARLRFPQGVRIEQGDVVVLPAYDGGVYGEVMHVESSPTQPEQYGYLSLPVALQSLRYLTIGNKPVAPRLPAEIASSTRAVVERYFLVPELHNFQLPTTTDATEATSTASSTNQP